MQENQSNAKTLIPGSRSQYSLICITVGLPVWAISLNFLAVSLPKLGRPWPKKLYVWNPR